MTTTHDVIRAAELDALAPLLPDVPLSDDGAEFLRWMLTFDPPTIRRFVAFIDDVRGETAKGPALAWTPGDPTLESAYEVLENETGGCLDPRCPNLDPIRKAKALLLAELEAADATDLAPPEDWQPGDRLPDGTVMLRQSPIGPAARLTHWRAEGPSAVRGFVTRARGISLPIIRATSAQRVEAAHAAEVVSAIHTATMAGAPEPHDAGHGPGAA